MSGSFRFAPPEPRPDLLTRPRLLRSLVGRWDHRITSLVGGPGLGKTTLLSQAIAENHLAPRGHDIWVGLEPQDADADQLARDVATATADHHGDADEGSGPGDGLPEPRTVAGTIWQRAPTEACVVLDDVHLVPTGSTGAAWLKDLVDALPANGHVVLASRADPPIPLGRYGAQGAVLRVAEDQLRFSDDELSGFAAQRGLALDVLDDLGGWPAMAELTAAAPASAHGHKLTGSYLWEEVLQPLGTLRRHVLAVVSDLEGADDALASAALGIPVQLADIFDGVPLVAEGAGGWFRPHALWRTAPGIELSPNERVEVRRRAVDHLVGTGQLDAAFRLVEDAGLWDVAPTVLRAAGLFFDRVRSTQLGRWLRHSPEAVRASTAGRLAIGVHRAFTAAPDAVEPLEQAADRCRQQADVDGEMAAVAQLARLAWWHQDRAALAPLIGRVAELEGTGNPTALALARFARAIRADVAGDDAGVIAELDGIEPSVLDPSWEALVAFLYCMVSLDLGDSATVYDVVGRLHPGSEGAFRGVLDSMRMRAWWHEGRVEEYTTEFDATVTEAMRQAGAIYQTIYSLTIGSITCAYVGKLVQARRQLDDAVVEMAASAADTLAPYITFSEAALTLADGDEDAAATLLRGHWHPDQWEKGPERRLWRRFLCLSYVLMPETRARWDALALRGFLATSRQLTQVVVALRSGDDGPLHRLGPVDVDVTRAALHHRFAAELAVGLFDAGRAEGRALIEALGEPGRGVLRDVARGGHPHAKGAKALLVAVPSPPAQACWLAVLGPQVLSRGGPDGDEVVDPDLRRMRVRELIAFLVTHRRTTRSAVTAALWPDLDERSAANNLGVTLSHLIRLLEPTREPGEPAYLLRVEGQVVQLVTGDHLQIDLDDFERRLQAAGQAEADGTPSVALQHYLEAVALYRGELHSEVPDADWLMLDREHCRSRFVRAAVRAGQLLLARGDAEQAEKVAQRALEADRWSEEAYAVLVGAALRRRDRSGAHRLLQRCLTVLDDLGIEPSASTQQLRRRVEAS